MDQKITPIDNVAAKLQASIIKRLENTCVFFNGVQNETCLAGVNYEKSRQIDEDVNKTSMGMPCIPLVSDTRPRWRCDLFRFPTKEEVEKEANRKVEAFRRSQRIMDHLIGTVGIRTLDNRSGSVPCPECQGTIRYSVASNGHIHAGCSTKGCFSVHQ